MLKIKKNTLARLTLFMLMLCMTFTITSCSEDEEANVQVSKEMLIGQWILVKDVVTVNGESETDEYLVEAREEVLTFNSDALIPISGHQIMKLIMEPGRWLLMIK